MSPLNALPVTFYDGASALGRNAWLQHHSGQFSPLEAKPPFAPLSGTEPAQAQELDWPEATTSISRMMDWPSGGQIQTKDAAAWDAWVRSHGAQPSIVQNFQSRWTWAVASLALLVGLGFSAYRWGVPAMARASLAFIPTSVDERIGTAIWPQIEGRYLQASRLGVDEQRRWQREFAQMLKSGYAGQKMPVHRLEIRRSKIGPNAFALPGGTVVLTDELVRLADKAPDQTRNIVLGVLAHEMGHVELRHGMRHLVTSTSLSLLATWLFGDVSAVMAAAPALLGQAQYSRDVEREADEVSRRIMRDAGISPLGMVKFFQLVRQAPLDLRMERCQDEARELLQRRKEISGDPQDISGEDIQVEAQRCVREAQERQAQSNRSGQSGSDNQPTGLWDTLGIAVSSHPSDLERVRAFERAAQPSDTSAK